MSTDNKLPVKDKITAQIDKTDESWALRLLNESQSEDSALKVDKTINKKEQPLEVSHNDHAIDTDENKIDTHITVNETGSDEITLKLSAIENQIFIHSQKKYETKTTDKKGLLTKPLSKIKAFFAA